ncbi:MAG: Asp-tRNA(Asn)/Glu-tRNA(Gln) amidotransferase subunit GatB [Patescibacteria group bacterium]
MSAYRPTIGLEIHAELKTRTKMFCTSKNDPDEENPNVNVCPVCMAYPGTLPVVNKEAVHSVLRVGAAVGGTIADYTEFDRKNYFYPDIPKGYQISQYEYPLVKGGELAGVKITRIHLEEDTANAKHRGDTSLIDFNRAGMPLMELVTEPVIHDAVTAGNFARELQQLLRALGVAEAQMEKGQMRVEVNISVSKDDTLGKRSEIKNINSFRAAERAIEFEIKRQTAVLGSGGVLLQETRGFDENTGETFSQRLKEDSNDYRYFPDPDIPKLKISDIPEFARDVLDASLPELPATRRARLVALGVRREDADVLIADHLYGAFFDAEVAGQLAPGLIGKGSNYLLTDVRAVATESMLNNLRNGVFGDVIRMTDAGDLSSRGTKDLLLRLMEKGGDAHTVAEKEGMLQMKDTALIERIVDEVVVEHQGVVMEVQKGKEEAMKFLIGMVMKKSKGAANPTDAATILKSKIQQKT